MVTGDSLIKKKKNHCGQGLQKGKKGSPRFPPSRSLGFFGVRTESLLLAVTCNLILQAPRRTQGGEGPLASPPIAPRPSPSPTIAPDSNKPSTFFPQPRAPDQGIYRGAARVGGRRSRKKPRQGIKMPLLIRPSLTTASRTPFLPMDAGLRASGEPRE